MEESREVYPNPPANGLPVQTHLTKFSRLRALIAVGLSGTNRDAPRIDEGENYITRRDLPHRFIEGISCPIGISLGRPEVATADLLPECLVCAIPSRCSSSFRRGWNRTRRVRSRSGSR